MDADTTDRRQTRGAWSLAEFQRPRWVSLVVVVSIAALWCVNFFAINDFRALAEGDFSCTDGGELANLEYSQFIRKVDHNASLPEEFAPRVLRWRSHVLIAHVEDTRETTPNTTTTTARRVVRLLQNATTLRVPHVRDVLRTGKSVQWRTLRTFNAGNGSDVEGPVQLAEAPDGSGVVIACSLVWRRDHQPSERGTAVFVSTNAALTQWHSAVHRRQGEETTRHLDLVRMPHTSVVGTPDSLVRVALVHGGTTSGEQKLMVQRFPSTDSFLSAAARGWHCGGAPSPGSNLTAPSSVTVRLPVTTTALKESAVVSATVTQAASPVHGHTDALHVFVRTRAGDISRVDVSLSAVCGGVVPPTAVVAVTPSGRPPFSDFRLLRFNARRFSEKTPNFSIFMAASRHTGFNTLHTATVASHKLQVVRVDGALSPATFSPCSPILMHLGHLRGLHSTQLSEDTVLVVYVREFRGVSSLHLAKVYVGNAHVAH